MTAMERGNETGGQDERETHRRHCRWFYPRCRVSKEAFRMYHNWYTGVAMDEAVAAAVLGPAAVAWARTAGQLLAVAGPTEA